MSDVYNPSSYALDLALKKKAYDDNKLSSFKKDKETAKQTRDDILKASNWHNDYKEVISDDKRRFNEAATKLNTLRASGASADEIAAAQATFDQEKANLAEHQTDTFKNKYKEDWYTGKGGKETVDAAKQNAKAAYKVAKDTYNDVKSTYNKSKNADPNRPKWNWKEAGKSAAKNLLGVTTTAVDANKNAQNAEDDRRDYQTANDNYTDRDNSNRNMDSEAEKNAVNFPDTFYRDAVSTLSGGPTGNVNDARVDTAQAQAQIANNAAAQTEMTEQQARQYGSQNPYSESGKIASVQNDAENRQEVNRADVLGPGAALARHTNTPDVQTQKQFSAEQRNIANQQMDKAIQQRGNAVYNQGLADQFRIQSRDQDADQNIANRLSKGLSDNFYDNYTEALRRRNYSKRQNIQVQNTPVQEPVVQEVQSTPVQEVQEPVVQEPVVQEVQEPVVQEPQESPVQEVQETPVQEKPPVQEVPVLESQEAVQAELNSLGISGQTVWNVLTYGNDPTSQWYVGENSKNSVNKDIINKSLNVLNKLGAKPVSLPNPNEDYLYKTYNEYIDIIPKAKSDLTDTFNQWGTNKDIRKKALIDFMAQVANTTLVKDHKDLYNSIYNVINPVYKQLKRNNNVTPNELSSMLTRIDTLYNNYHTRLTVSASDVGERSLTYADKNKLDAFVMQQYSNLAPLLLQKRTVDGQLKNVGDRRTDGSRITSAQANEDIQL